MNNLSISFAPVVTLIKSSRIRVFQTANAALIELYWDIGRYISHRIAKEEWGNGVVAELARYINRTEPSVKGFSDKNLWRMKQFYKTYKGSTIVAAPRRLLPSEPFSPQQEVPISKTALTQLSWTHHRTIFGRCKSIEEKEFYINQAIREHYSVRELERQIDSSLFERIALSNAKPAAAPPKLPPDATGSIRDNYVFEFLNLPEPHSENDLQKAIIRNLKKFLLEFNRDFAFLGEEFPLQVGNKDFALDLLFFNRSLNCLVVIELKVTEFVPEQLGKLNFYLEALDRDVRKPHENPSIGILLCKAKDDEVVEYAMSRQLSPVMVAQYQLQLPDKKLLQARLHEFFEQNEKDDND